ncbi:MAG: hypothetical protein C4542_06910 [Dehalococcoidia bacterium]|nr:MAG: hypothetical protein C4542_06910 [Dehalococcoidia bacterium]
MPQNKTTDTVVKEKSPLAFRFSYILLPCLLACVCIVLATVLYSRLPAELGLRFKSDGTPLSLLNKGTFVALMLGLQVGVAATAFFIALIFLKLAGIMARNSVLPVNLPGFIFLMSNMLLLPQLILGYLMLDSFIYALNGTHWISFTTFALWAVGIGTIIIFTMFGRLFAQLRAGVNKK